MTTAPQIFNVVDYAGFTGDDTGSTSADAIQNAINDACAIPSYYGSRGGKVYMPPGACARITKPILIPKPIEIEFNGTLDYVPTTGDCLFMGSAGGWQVGGKVYVHQLINSGGYQGMATGVAPDGTNGIRKINGVMSDVTIDRVIGFTCSAFFADGNGEFVNPQVNQHCHQKFGQIGNCGAGLLIQSVDAVTSSSEADLYHVKQSLGCFYGFMLTNPAGNPSSSSNRIVHDALDDVNTAAGGQGGVVDGSSNLIDCTYLGCNIWFGPNSRNNTLNLYNSAADGATFTPGGSGNIYNRYGRPA